MLNTLVPVFRSLPKPANQHPPHRQIAGMDAMVSILLTVVGHLNNPIAAGKGGFSLGFPCFL